jgi:hypothetical protein
MMETLTAKAEKSTTNNKNGKLYRPGPRSMANSSAAR